MGRRAPGAGPASDVPIDGPGAPTSGPEPEREVDEAVRAARSALAGWSGTPIKERAQVFFRYKRLLEVHANDLAALIHRENGKILAEAMAEVEKLLPDGALHAAKVAEQSERDHLETMADMFDRGQR